MEHDLHSRVSFVDDGLLGKVKCMVTSYYAKRFEELRKICYLSELDFIWSVSRCKKSVAQGGKGNLFSTESLDDRFLVKQVTNTELESFIKFAPAYFEHLTGALLSQCSTCLQKIVGIYQVTTKQLKGREESKWDIVVMENLWFDHCNVTRVHDLKDCCGSDSSEGNKVLSDQDLVGTMTIPPPIFVRRKCLMLLERAIWNDSFSCFYWYHGLLSTCRSGGRKQELVVGITGYLRRYARNVHSRTSEKGFLGFLR